MGLKFPPKWPQNPAKMLPNSPKMSPQARRTARPQGTHGSSAGPPPRSVPLPPRRPSARRCRGGSRPLPWGRAEGSRAGSALCVGKPVTAADSLSGLCCGLCTQSSWVGSPRVSAAAPRGGSVSEHGPGSAIASEPAGT